MKRQLIIAALSAITLSIAPVTERVKTPRVEATTSVQAQKDTEARVAAEKEKQERLEKEKREKEEKERQEKEEQERKAEEERKQKEEAERLAEEKKQAEEQVKAESKAKAEEEAQVAADKAKDESVAKEKEAEEKAKTESEAKEKEDQVENEAKDDEDVETQKTDATKSDDEKTEDEDEEVDKTKAEDDKDKAGKKDSDGKLALVSVPSVSFGTVAAGQSRNAKASGSLKVVNSQKKTGWMVTVSADGFKDAKGQTLDGAILNLNASGQTVSGGDNGKLPVAQSVGNLVKGGTALKAGAGTTGTFTVNYTADAFGIKLPDDISAGEYSSQLSWNLKAEPES